MFFLIYLTGSVSTDYSTVDDEDCNIPLANYEDPNDCHMPWTNREDPNSLATCTKCHVDPNAIKSYLHVNLVERSVTATCMRGDKGRYDFPQAPEGCHSIDPLNEEMFIGRSHPTDVQPKKDMDVPEELHLDVDVVSCTTCHDPHKEYKSEERWVSSSKEGSEISETEFRTYYLRRPNLATKVPIGNDLCVSCHTSKL
ncbi:MAG: hypothetical protein ACMUIA_11965 [bacterium]